MAGLGMKILHVIPSISLEHGGPSVALATMARGLVERGVAVDIATTDDDGPGGRLAVPLGVPVTRDGVTHIYFRKQTELYKASFGLRTWLERSVRDYDLIHVHALFSHSSVAAARQAFRQGVPYIVRPLGVLNRWGMINRRRWLKAMSFRIVERPLLRHAAAIHFTSRQEQAEASRLGLKTRPVVIPLGIDLREFASLPERTEFLERFPKLAGRPIVLFLSRIDPKKGIELLLEAFSKIAERLPEPVLVIAGKGEADYAARLRAKAARLIPDARIVWAGFLQDRDKLAAFSAADLFVLPSHSENFGVAAVEAMAAGLACVVSEHVAVAEEIAAAQAGAMVQCDVAELAQAIERLLVAPALRASYARNARRLTSECFSMDVMTQRLITVYEELITAFARRSSDTAWRPVLADGDRGPHYVPRRSVADGALRVLHVIPSVGPVRGGPTEAVLGTVRALNSHGLCAEILTTNDNGPEVLDVPLGRCIQYAGVPIRFFPRLNSPLKPLRDFAFSASLTRWLARHLADYDLIHVHALFSYAPTAAMQLARRRRVPYLVRPLGLLCTWAMQQSALRKRAYLALGERANLNASAGLEYTAEQELAEAAALGLKAPAFVLPFGFDLPTKISDARARLRQKLGVAPDEPVLLFLARLHHKKGLHLLLEAIEKLGDERGLLVVAGTGSDAYERQVRERASRGALRGRVHFVGFAAGEFKQLLLQGADVFALTSYSESFAIAAMEAMAAGTPVLLTPGVPLAEIVNRLDTGWVTTLEPAAITLALREALKSLRDVDVSRSRRERCRAVAANFEWARISVRMKTVYEAVLQRRPLPSFEISKVTL